MAARAGLDELVASIGPLDSAAMAATARRLDRLTKPPGSLGRLETLAIELAGIRGGAVTTIRRPAIVVFAGDHGVTTRGVSPYPSDVTRQMLANFAAGGAAINVLASAARADLIVVDVGVAGPPLEPPTDPAPRTTLVRARVAAGTRDLSVVPAMTSDEVANAIAVGRQVVDGLIDDGCDLIGVGEMGIGNTTASSAIVATLLGRPADAVTGRGTGLDDAGVRRKAEIVETALARHRLDARRPLDVLAAVGGLEIAALVGAILAAAGRHIPVLLDGFITGAAALVAARLGEDVPARLIASHRSAEPGHRLVLEELGLDPLLDLGLRLGEGSGAALAMPIVVAAARIVDEMATFDDAGVSDRA